MTWVDLLIGRRPPKAYPRPLPERVITAPPAGVTWTEVRARPDGRRVRARLVRRSGVLKTPRGPMRYQAGRHYIIDYGGGDRAVARRDVFERVYAPDGAGGYTKRPEISYRFFTLPYPATIVTLEGRERANAGDWIMQGVNGELYPMTPERGRELYSAI